jgi:hypothetical protein
VDDLSFAQEWGPLIAAGFAAAAAVASWVSATNARRTWRDSRRPQLTARIHDVHDQPLLLRVRNIGGGPAKQITFQVVIDGHAATGHLPPDGFLGPGDATSIEMQFPPNVDTDGARYVLMCLDRENDTYGWSREDKERAHKRRRWSKVRTIGSMFEKFYGRGADREDLTFVSWDPSERRM